jgi:hypothetical protein
MSTSHVSWGSIELLHNVVRTLTHLHELGQSFPVVEYRAKVKLHGSNCAVQITDSGIVAQSRTALLTSESDYKGFATWVAANAAYFGSLRRGSVVFGEWCGPGVEKGMAISKAKRKVFAVFAVQIGASIIYDPDDVRGLLPIAGDPDDLFVLPWEGAPITIDYGSRAQLDAVAAELNGRVEAVEREDPWVKSVLGISGLGEGLVFYPTKVDGDSPDTEPQHLATLMFKAKGEKHRTAGTKTAVQVDASIVASVDDFVSLMLTEARLQQGLAVVEGRDPKRTGAFLTWIAADVRKESVAELEASGLTWAQVDKAIQVRARSWFLSGTSS